MRCKQCGLTFRFSIWIMQCGECKDQYCTKCMTRKNGICYCTKCTVLIARPPEIAALMKLKSKDLHDYLKRHNIATYGLVEKRELVEVLCKKTIPVKTTKTATVFNKIFSNFESVINLPERYTPERSPRAPPERPIYASTSSGNLFTNPQFQRAQTASTNSLHREQPTTSTAEASRLVHPNKIPQLEDFRTKAELDALSAKELKIVLTYNRVDYKGCVEKSELLEKVQRLWQDQSQKNEDGLNEDAEELCKICMDAPLDCVLLECGHIATCTACGKKLAECPICRQYVSRVVRTFKA